MENELNRVISTGTQFSEQYSGLNHKSIGQVTRIIVRFTPVCIFCAMAFMIIKLDLSSIISVAGWMGLIYLYDGRTSHGDKKDV